MVNLHLTPGAVWKIPPSFIFGGSLIKMNRILLKVKTRRPVLLQGHGQDIGSRDVCIVRGIPGTEITGMFLRVQSFPPDKLQVQLEAQCR